MPGGDLRFRALKTFDQYVEGLTYTARTPELKDSLARWISEGLAELDRRPVSEVGGSGKVED